MKPLSPAHLRLCMGALPPPVRAVLRHLLDPASGMAGVSQILAEDEPGAGLAELDPVEQGGFFYGPVFERFEQRMFAAEAVQAAERRRATVELQNLLAEAPARWHRRVADDPGMASIPLAIALLGSSRCALPGEPCAAEARARFALAVLDQVDAPGPPDRRQDPLTLGLRVSAWAVVGHALALNGDREGAEAAFGSGSRLVLEHLGSEEEADLLERHALFLYEQGRVSEALAQLTRAGEVLAELGELPRARAALERLGMLYFDLGELVRSCHCFALALAYAEQLGEEAAARILRHQLAWTLLMDDQVEDAREILAGASPSAGRAEELPTLRLLLERRAGSPREKVAALAAEIARAHVRGEAFQVGLYAVLLAREILRGEPGPELPRLASYVLAAAESPQLAIESRAWLRRLAAAFAEGQLTLALVIESAQSLRYADEDEPDEPISC